MEKIVHFYFKHKKLVQIMIILFVIIILLAMVATTFLNNPKGIDLKELNVYKKDVELPKKLDKEVLTSTSWQLAGKSGKYELYYKQDEMLIKIVDIATGESWTNYFEKDKYEGELSEANAQNMKQLFSIGYSDFDVYDGYMPSNSPNVENKAEYVENGVKINFNFKELNIELMLYIWIDENGLCVKIPNDTIKEKNIGVTKIDMLPFFGSANKRDLGYFIYPDGCGTLYNFENQGNVKSGLISKNTYGMFRTNIDEMNENNENGIKNIAIPYFGGQSNGKGFLGYILEGDSDAIINLSTYGYGYHLSRIYPSHVYRKSYELKNVDGKVANIVDKKRIRNHFTVKYLLDAKDSNYSKLANKLREFIVTSGLLGKGNTDTNLNLEILMGAVEKTGFFEKFVTVTTFQQASDIAKAIGEKVKKIDYNMTGWQKNGMYSFPDVGALETSLGEQKNLNSFQNIVEANGGTVYYAHNIMFANANNKGFDNNYDVVFDNSGKPITDSTKKIFLLDFYRMSNQFISRTAGEFKSLQIGAVTLEGVGKYAFDDNNAKNELSKSQMILSLKRFTAQTGKDFKYAFNTGNAYTLPFASKLINFPEKNSSYEAFHEEIPFNQMLLHGRISYSLETPGNMAESLTDIKLKWAEFGAVPYFLITYDSTVKLSKTKVNNIYSSVFSDWRSDIEQIAKEFEDKMGALQDKTIVSHLKQNELAQVQYSDGSMVYVNYANEDKTINGIVVPKKSYVVKGG